MTLCIKMHCTCLHEPGVTPPDSKRGLRNFFVTFSRGEEQCNSYFDWLYLKRQVTHPTSSWSQFRVYHLCSTCMVNLPLVKNATNWELMCIFFQRCSKIGLIIVLETNLVQEHRQSFSQLKTTKTDVKSRTWPHVLDASRYPQFHCHTQGESFTGRPMGNSGGDWLQKPVVHFFYLELLSIDQHQKRG